MNKIDFKTSGYFPLQIIYFGVFLIVVGIPALYFNLIIGLISCFASFVILTTHYRLSLDLNNKVYHDYLWIAGLRNGEKGKFDSIEYLFIKKNRLTETMHVRIASSTMKKEVFDGYLKFSDDTKIHVGTTESKDKLVRKLKDIASQLKVRVIDYSEKPTGEILIAI